MNSVGKVVISGCAVLPTFNDELSWRLLVYFVHDQIKIMILRHKRLITVSKNNYNHSKVSWSVYIEVVVSVCCVWVWKWTRKVQSGEPRGLPKYWRKIIGTAVFVPIGITLRPLSALCAMSEKVIHSIQRLNSTFFVALCLYFLLENLLQKFIPRTVFYTNQIFCTYVLEICIKFMNVS